VTGVQTCALPIYGNQAKIQIDMTVLVYNELNWAKDCLNEQLSTAVDDV
jgi:hypothetical protein